MKSRELRRLRCAAAACLGAALLLAASTEARVLVPPARPALWTDPGDIQSRDLFYGPGGERHQPRGAVFAFIKEDLAGSSPKFDVRDQAGTKWRIKLGPEARPEVVASRLVWAIGYAADEDYFLHEVRITGMPREVHRGRKLIGPDGAIHDVRLKRESADQKTVGTWPWRDGPFSGTRELNGLRVLMALINNWDLKDVNNGVRAATDRDGAVTGELVYEVKDLGSSFGSTGLERTAVASDGNLPRYARSPFITRITTAYIDFAVPRRAAWIVLANPTEFFARLRLRWIGRRIPREDAKWLGRQMARLPPAQISSRV